MVREDTIGEYNQLASYSDNFIVATNIPSLTWLISPKIAPGSEEYSKAYIESLIRYKAHINGLNEDLMVAISYCESGHQMKWNYLHESNPDFYTAFGPFQIIKGHEIKYGTSRMTLDGNISVAIKLYQDEGLKPWKLSEDCILSTARP